MQHNLAEAITFEPFVGDGRPGDIAAELCGALIPYVVDPVEVQKITNVQVFNTKAISIRVAEMCVSLGLSHGPLTIHAASSRIGIFSRSCNARQHPSIFLTPFNVRRMHAL